MALEPPQDPPERGGREPAPGTAVTVGRAGEEAAHPKHGRFRQLGPVLAGAAPVPRPAPLRDGAETDTDALLSAAGYSAAELAALRSEGVIA